MRGLRLILSLTLVAFLTAGLGVVYPGTHAQGAVLTGISLTKTVLPDRIHAGDQVTYTIMVSNDSGFTVDVDIVDETLGFSQQDVLLDPAESSTFTLGTNPTVDVTNTVAALATVINGGGYSDTPRSGHGQRHGRCAEPRCGGHQDSLAGDSPGW